MAAQGKSKGKSKQSWEKATEDAVKNLPAGTYPVVMQVEVKAASPGIVHEYIVEVG